MSRTKTKLLALLSLVLLCWQGCAEQGSQPEHKDETPPAPASGPRYVRAGYEFPYQLSQPKQVHPLDQALVEISGLAYIQKDLLACVQDEQGIIYLYDLKARKVINRIEFAPPGDFEAVASQQDTFWVLRSDGQLYRVDGQGDAETFQFPQLKGAELEGLAYQPDRGRLLLACKKRPDGSDSLKGKRPVFAFDLGRRVLDPVPAYLVNPRDIPAPGKDGKTKFKPSGIAVHPLSGDIYLLGGKARLLLVLSAAGELEYAEVLDQELFPQPEGICFSPDGSLFIASEGAGGEGRIVVYGK